MIYSLSCKDLGEKNCLFIVRGEDKEVLIDKMMDHVLEDHGDKMQEMMATMSTEDIRKVFKDSIVEEAEVE